MIAQALIDSGADVNATDRDGNTALHKTAKLGNFSNSTIWILTLKFKFTTLNSIFGIISKYSGTIAVADLLVKARAGLNNENNHGETPLKLAKASGTSNLKRYVIIVANIDCIYIKGHRAEYESMLSKNGKKAGYSQVYDDPEVFIDAASNG